MINEGNHLKDIKIYGKSINVIGNVACSRVNPLNLGMIRKWLASLG